MFESYPFHLFLVLLGSTFFFLAKAANMWNEIIYLQNELQTLNELNNNIKQNNQFLQLVIVDILNVNKPNTYKWNNLFSQTVRQIYATQGNLSPLTSLEIFKKQEKWRNGLEKINEMEKYVIDKYLYNLWNIDKFKHYNTELVNFEIEMFFSKLRFLYSDYMINSIFFERNNNEFFQGESFQHTNNLTKYFNNHTLPKSFEREYRDFYKIKNKTPISFIRPFSE